MKLTQLIMISLAIGLFLACAPKPVKTNESNQTSAAYYVGGKNASDNNDGTKKSPFATISKAASLLKAGDICYIRAGIYRETVVPKNSGTPGKPIVFTSDGYVDVVISGTEKADGGWTVHRGDIYQKTIKLPVTGYNKAITGNSTLLANQVFSDGKMMIEARWPNVTDSDDLMNRDDFRKVPQDGWISGEGTTIRDAGIPEIPGGWTGATIWTIGWYVPGTSTISASSPGEIKFPLVRGEKHRGLYYLTGVMGALDAEKEWFYDGSKLFFRAAGGGIPSNMEVKMRNFAFDLTGKSHITIRNISMFAANIVTDNLSNDVNLDRLKGRYVSHFVAIHASPVKLDGVSGDLYAHGHETGILLMGENSTIKNSIIEYSAGQGIVLGAAGGVAENNIVSEISYGGTYCCGIMPRRDNAPQRISHNTIFRTGRSGIDGIGSNKDIGYNDIYEFGFINTDLGAIYSANTLDLTGTRIHHNWLHDARNDRHHRYPVGAGIYLDQGARPALIHHNVFWNNYKNDIRIQQDKPPYNFIYNNTMASDYDDFWFTYHSYSQSPPENSNNNIYVLSIKPDTPGTNEITSGTDPLFVNSSAGGLGFRLKAGSPAIDYGQVIEGVTSGFEGKAPDAGAYEFNGTEWKAGAGILSKPGPVISDKVK